MDPSERFALVVEGLVAREQGVELEEAEDAEPVVDGDDDEVGDGDEGRGIVQAEVGGRAVRCVAAVEEDEDWDLWADCAICVVNEKI